MGYFVIEVVFFKGARRIKKYSFNGEDNSTEGWKPQQSEPPMVVMSTLHLKKKRQKLLSEKKKKKILNREKGDVPPEHLHFPFASEVSS